MKSKMRIQTLDQEGRTLTDRLVDQTSEFTLGPKEKHKGAIKLEVVLRTPDDIKGFNDYMDKLKNDLPLPEKKVYKTGKKAISLLDEEPLRDMLKEAERKCKTLDDLVKYLRERNFQFVTHQFIEDRDLKIEIKPNHNDWQFMIRVIKEAKNPLNNKYDPQLIVAFKYMGKKLPGAKVYMYNKFLKTIEIDWAAKSDINFKKMKLKKFPPYMIQEERDRYRLEEAKYKANPEAVKSKFWERWNGPVEGFNK